MSLAVDDEQLVRGYSGILFLAMSIAWVGIEIGRQILPPLLPTIIDELSISPFLAGFALTVMWGTYALFHYPAGRLADKLSRKTILVFGLFVLAVGFLGLGVVSTYPVFLLTVMIIGGGTAFYFIAMRLLVADLFVVKRAQALGIQLAFGQFGSALAAGRAIVVLAYLSWRGAFIPIGVLLLGIVVFLHGWIDEPYVIEPVSFGLRGTVDRVFGSVTLQRALVAYVLIIFTWQGALGFLPTFLQVEKGFPPVLASGGFALVFLIGMIVGPLAGRYGDRHSKLAVAASGVVVAAVGLFFLTRVDSLGWISVSVIVFAVGLMAYPPVMQAYLLDTFSDASMGGDFGAFKTVYSGIGSLGPSYVGYVGGEWNYTLAYLGLVGSLCLGVVFLGLVWSTRDPPGV